MAETWVAPPEDHEWLYINTCVACAQPLKPELAVYCFPRGKAPELLLLVVALAACVNEPTTCIPRIDMGTFLPYQVVQQLRATLSGMLTHPRRGVVSDRLCVCCLCRTTRQEASRPTSPVSTLHPQELEQLC